ncbi:MAG: class I SAM-dependent methyltransferase, partial [Magnetococcales bacterium]|nr:class I SAM-dependent methyltransferase [Magnetococcales bacterium]
MEKNGGCPTRETGQRSTSPADPLQETRVFWNAHPCDGQAGYDSRFRFRFDKESWLLPRLEELSRRGYRRFLEVGCGQGTDTLTLCRMLPPGSRYVGVDLSEVSLQEARSAAASVADRLRVIPEFFQENAESLSFADGSFDCVYSMGVLHHTPETGKAVNEVLRVLEPGGLACIILYRRWSPKLLVAHALRLFQAGLDRFLGTKRILLRLVDNRLGEVLLGTMLKECFGVPVLRSYTGKEIDILFAGFSRVRKTPYGWGLPALGLGSRLGLGATRLGYFWYVEAVKGGGPSPG